MFAQARIFEFCFIEKLFFIRKIIEKTNYYEKVLEIMKKLLSDHTSPRYNYQKMFIA